MGASSSGRRETASARLGRSVVRSSGSRKEALLAAQAALDASDPRVLVGSALSLKGDTLEVGELRYRLGQTGKVFVIGGGKCSGLMAVKLEEVLGDRIESGVVVVPDYQRNLPRLDGVKFAKSTHPLPSETGVAAAEMIVETVGRAKKGDLVICLISGGGSALMPLPVPGVSVAELHDTTRLLLRSGAEIGEINCVRKHLSKIGGGRLAQMTGGASVLSLIISDVVGDDLGLVASGPTVADPTTFAMARVVLEKHHVWGSVPPSVRAAIAKGISGGMEETPKPGSTTLARVINVMVGSNGTACAAARARLAGRGFKVLSSRVGVTGEANIVGQMMAAEARSWPAEAVAAVWGGETTVTVSGKGSGGRNQELALGAVEGLGETDGVALLSMGTDGIDGPTDAAGAVIDSETAARAKALSLDPAKFLAANDSYRFFEALDDLVVTGPTGTNVNDLMVMVKSEP